MVPFVAKVLESCADSRVSIFISYDCISQTGNLTGVDITCLGVKYISICI